ncbi:hypothetical protein H1R20_g10998, partial [Candolleomyces eurysporus]
MGQRHQIFVVARVSVAPGKPRQYRCIAALHHQWCYGKLPLYAINSFKRLARVPENAALIEEELATYHERKKFLPGRPCPYTSYLTESAFSVDLVRESGPYSSGVLILDADMGSRDGDNNDGITILDVTTPRNPAYCLVSIYGLEVEVDIQPTMTPLTAAQYLRSYYPIDNPREYDAEDMEQERYNLGAIANLDDMPLIPITTLAKVWPNEYAAPNDGPQDSEPSDGSKADSAEAAGFTAQLTAYPAEIDALRKRSTLSTEDIAQLTTASKGAMEPDGIVDLARFPLTADQILAILKELHDFKRLDVSHCQAVDSRVFLHLVKTYKHLRWINILHCPISEEDLKELVINDPRRFRSIEAILHPTFLTGQIPADFPQAFRLACISGSWRPVDSVALPFFVTDQLVQNLLDLCSNIDAYSTPHSSVLASIRRSPDQSWQDRAIQLVPDCDRRERNNFREGYQFLVLYAQKKYGILPPLAPGQANYTDSDVIGLELFLKRLEEEGSPSTDVGAANRLLDLVAGMKLLTAEEIKAFEGPAAYW